MIENYFNYFTEIEEHFQRARGTSLFLLSPLDWALIEAWKNSGIPLEAVLRGIDQAFEKWRAKPPRARIQLVNSVAYCAQAVAKEAQVMADGERAPRREAPPPFVEGDVATYLQRNALALKSAGYDDLADSLDALNTPAAVGNLEELEQRLTVLEEKMIARVRSTANDETLLEIRQMLD
ncbi:MAG: hypothetical protein ABI824_17470, partial [Acidobacteriota bacterium]